jgi:hypothetical protein
VLDRFLRCGDDKLGVAGFTDAGQRILQAGDAPDARRMAHRTLQRCPAFMASISGAAIRNDGWRHVIPIADGGASEAHAGYRTVT